MSNLRKAATLFIGGTGLFITWEILNGNPKMYSNHLMPILHATIPPEKAHLLAIKTMKYARKSNFHDPDCLETEVWGKKFSNPIGIAAGFDKHAEAMEGLSNIGFGFVEIGSVTPLPQTGNPLPRVFRLSEDKAVINRYGFNSHGHEAVFERLKRWRQSDTSTFLGVNLGKNKDTDDHVKDYVKGVIKLGDFADYIVINVSSPNTPGLRKLQGDKYLKDLLCAVNKERNLLSRNPKPILLVKIAPDLESKDVEDICKTVTCNECGVNGLIISNTTVRRPDTLTSKHKNEIGGLSGPPVKEQSTELIKKIYSITGGKIPIIGVGGISNGHDAYEKIKAGASLVQFYTALIYQGTPVLKTIKTELAELVEKDGFNSVKDAVGRDHHL
ncbi:dihydroorotate dehydrogenase (quinone), mitochondrial-like [Styela clava]|uniref:dihydroorotate dehydrogenase (quinone), mitochondrial-like n=1 Tax=Styela clava TaxID=7725 RepID=UPI00193A1E4C|nr:dihydroorotate dehydrogenase (quinone), mitochondrial-like [Styela clava]